MLNYKIAENIYKVKTVKEDISPNTNALCESEVTLPDQELKESHRKLANIPSKVKTTNISIKPTHEMTMDEFLEISNKEILENSLKEDIPPMPTKENPDKY